METDVYRIDAEQAIRAMRELAASVQESTRVTQEAGDKTTASMFKAEAAFEAAKRAAEFLFDQLKEGIGEAVKSEQVFRQLQRATGDNAEAFRAQALAMQEHLGVSKLSVEQMQTLLSIHGAIPGKINDTILAVENYAAATGHDAKEALEGLVMGTERGSGSIKALGIHIKTTGEFTQDLALYTQQLAEHYGGAAAANAETFAGKMAKLNAEISELKEGFGNFFITIESRYQVLGALAEAFKAARRSMGEDVDDDAEKKRGVERMHLEAERAEKLEHVKKVMEDIQAFQEGRGSPLQSMKDLSSTMAQLDQEIAKIEKRLDVIRVADAGPVGGGSPHSTAKEDNGAEARQAKAQAIIDANAKFLEDMHKRDEEAERHAQSRLDAGKEESARKHQEAMTKIENEFAQKRADLRKKESAEAIQIEDQMQKTLEGYAEQGLSFVIGKLGDQLVANTQFTKRMTELTIQRGQVTDYEGRVLFDHAAAQKQLQKEATATFEKQTADFLMNIAKQAAVRAIMEGAEAIGSYAADRYDAGAKHAAAAIAFGAVAAAAGGGAYLLSSTRGLTGEEKKQLQDAQNQQTDRAAREAKNAAQSHSSTIGTQVTIYQIGISGLTETEQMNQLDQLRRKYAQLGTGSAVN